MGLGDGGKAAEEWENKGKGIYLLCWDQTQGLVNARQELKYILSP
jgi:hypothetical protein